MSRILWAMTFAPVSLNVVGRDHIIEYAQTEAFLRLDNPVQITASITRFDSRQRLERLERTGPPDERNAVIERLERFGLQYCWALKGCLLFYLSLLNQDVALVRPGTSLNWATGSPGHLREQRDISFQDCPVLDSKPDRVSVA